jgi:hypothetical protein
LRRAAAPASRFPAIGNAVAADLTAGSAARAGGRTRSRRRELGPDRRDQAGEREARGALQVTQPGELALLPFTVPREVTNGASAQLVDVGLRCLPLGVRRMLGSRLDRFGLGAGIGEPRAQCGLSLLQLIGAAAGVLLGSVTSAAERLAAVRIWSASVSASRSIRSARAPKPASGAGVACRPERTTRISSSTATACCSAMVRLRSLSSSAARSSAMEASNRARWASTAAASRPRRTVGKAGLLGSTSHAAGEADWAEAGVNALLSLPSRLSSR